MDNCKKLLELIVNERSRYLTKNNLCLGCYDPISSNHSAKTCIKRITCNECKNYHPTALHVYQYKKQNNAPQKNDDGEKEETQFSNRCTEIEDFRYFVGQFFQNNQQIKKQDELKTEFDLIENEKFFFVQIIHALLISWKEILRSYTESINNPVIQDHHLIKKYQILSLNKLNSATLYEILIDANNVKPTSQTYFENLFSNFKPDWKSIYLLPRRVTLDTNLRMFQYKLLNNVLYLNNMLFRFKKVDSPLCSYCNEEEETPLHLFHSCLKTKQLWNKLRQYFQN